eukprot:8117-Heterococcus_DN1.PRE.7
MSGNDSAVETHVATAHQATQSYTSFAHDMSSTQRSPACAVANAYVGITATSLLCQVWTSAIMSLERLHLPETSVKDVLVTISCPWVYTPPPPNPVSVALVKVDFVIVQDEPSLQCIAPPADLAADDNEISTVN